MRDDADREEYVLWLFLGFCLHLPDPREPAGLGVAFDGAGPAELTRCDWQVGQACRWFE